MKKPLRVLLMMSSVAMGGAERNIVSLLPYFRAAGAEVILCTMNKRRDSQLASSSSLDSVERIDLGAKRLLDPAALKRLFSFIREKQINIIHAQDQDTIIFAGLCKLFLGIPTVMTRHVLEEPSLTWKKKIRSRMVLLAARYGITRVIAVSEMVRESFSKQAHIPLSKIEKIYNGIELDKFHRPTKRDELRLKLNWSLDRPIAAFISVLRPGKGFELLFECIPDIQRRFPDFQVKLIGGGKLESQLREQASPLGEAVEFLGQRMDIPDLIGASDLLIQASWSEALPTVLIEAGAASVPVVATNVGGSAEIVQDGVGGFLVPPGDREAIVNAVVKLLQDPVEARQMGGRAYQYVSQVFSLEKQARATVGLYERVFSE